MSWVLKGNGGIHSTQEDMYKWYKALKENKVLSKSLTEVLTTPYVIERESGSSHYAYGWAIFTSDRNTKVVSHNGGNRVFFHEFIWLSEEDIVIIFSTNASSREVEVTWRIERMIFDENYQADPIKKNLQLLVFDFIRHNELQESNKLIAKIKEEYSSYLNDPVNLNKLGYRLLETKKNSAWAVEIFEMNVQLFPSEGNSWDSLGDAYFANELKEEAIKSYKKALELKPETDCYWCDNSKTKLAELAKE